MHHAFTFSPGSEGMVVVADVLDKVEEEELGDDVFWDPAF